MEDDVPQTPVIVNKPRDPLTDLKKLEFRGPNAPHPNFVSYRKKENESDGVLELILYQEKIPIEAGNFLRCPYIPFPIFDIQFIKIVEDEQLLLSERILLYGIIPMAVWTPMLLLLVSSVPYPQQKRPENPEDYVNDAFYLNDAFFNAEPTENTVVSTTVLRQYMSLLLFTQRMLTQQHEGESSEAYTERVKTLDEHNKKIDHLHNVQCQRAKNKFLTHLMTNGAFLQIHRRGGHFSNKFEKNDVLVDSISQLFYSYIIDLLRAHEFTIMSLWGFTPDQIVFYMSRQMDPPTQSFISTGKQTMIAKLEYEIAKNVNELQQYSYNQKSLTDFEPCHNLNELEKQLRRSHRSKQPKLRNRYCLSKRFVVESFISNIIIEEPVAKQLEPAPIVLPTPEAIASSSELFDDECTVVKESMLDDMF